MIVFPWSFLSCEQRNYIDVLVATSDGSSVDNLYATDVDDEHVDNHDCDDNTDDDHMVIYR